jgi:predicted amidohydrolase YtcJ
MDGSEESLRLLLALEGQGELPLRVYYSMSITPETPADVLREFAALKERYPSERVRLGAIKMFMDGVIESYTALLLEEYADQIGQQGGAHFSPQQFQAVAFEAERLGLQMIVHAIGDGAVRRALDGFAAVQGAHGPRDRRHRIEHIELIHPSDLARFAELGVIASMQPLHVPMEVHGEDIWPRRVGEARWRYSFAWRDLRQSGARLIFGSDWPVVTQNPFRGFAAALNRPPWTPDLPDQRQSLIETIDSYTHHAAYAEFQEHQKGMLRRGFLADMVLLSEDLFAMPPQEIGRVHPLLTICNGRIVYQA